MRIRKCASRLLGSAYSSAPSDPAPRFELPPPPPPPPPLYPGAGPESRAGGAGFAASTASGEPCELSRSPWDLIGELDLSGPQEEDLVGKYFVHVACRASWLFPTSMTATAKKEEELAVAAVHDDSAQPRHEVAKKPPAKKTVVKKEEEEKKEGEPKKKAKVKKEEGDGEAAGGGAAQVWTCKKNDGKRWHCQRQVSRPNALCDYHFEQKRSYYNPVSESLSAAAPAAASSASAASKPSSSAKPRRKKSGDAGEGFYYYTGFGPFRTKRHCRSSSMQESTPVKQEEEEAPPENHAAPTSGKSQVDDADHQAAGRDDESSCDDIAGIAGGDEESSDDNGHYTHGCNGNGEPRAGVNGDSKRKTQWKKRWRKPVKARSLKSLM